MPRQPCSATTCRYWPTSAASRGPSRARTTTSCPARPSRSSSSSSTTRARRSRATASGRSACPTPSPARRRSRCRPASKSASRLSSICRRAWRRASTRWTPRCASATARRRKTRSPSTSCRRRSRYGPSKRIAVFDPNGETSALLRSLGVTFDRVNQTNADLRAYDVFIVGKGALTLDRAAPDISRVRDGMKVIIFEQTADVLEKRFGFRTEEYGLRWVFKRVPDHPLLAGLRDEHLGIGAAMPRSFRRDWRTNLTTLPPWNGPAPRQAGLALRQPGQRGLGAHREAGLRRLPVDPRRRLCAAVHLADGVPRGARHGAVLPDRRERADRERPGRRDAGQEHLAVCSRLAAGAAPQRRLRRRAGGEAVSRFRRSRSGRVPGRQALAGAGARGGSRRGSARSTRKPSATSSERAAGCWRSAWARRKRTRSCR